MSRPDAPKSRISLRNCVAEDDQFLLNVFASTRETELASFPEGEIQQYFLVNQFLAQRSHYALHYPGADLSVVLDGDEPIGRFYVARQEDEIRILDLALLPERRNRGIGTRLLRDLVAEADSRGLPMRIWVETFNPSLRLFERLGFSVAEEKGFHYLLERRPSAS